ncbi:hypothetical protein WME97_48430 [Sorangium sp. So ce367]|uniref:hypothetical protein n=1 Tax=Sorangium sp. So ce367 TaxID=3133305 RepID=UPI003F5E26AB
MTRTALAAVLVALTGCNTSSTTLDPPPYGNPAGYRVHVLQGDSLSAGDVTLNDLVVDTSSVEAIDSSVAAMVADTGETTAPHTVDELTTGVPDLTVDFTGVATPVPATFHGAGIQWRSKFFLGDARYKALVRHARIDLLRFPSGQERVMYDGSDDAIATDPVADTLGGDPYEFRMSAGDVRRYIEFCTELGIEAMPEVNITVDDVDREKAYVAQIVDDLGYDLRYVSAGNEPDNKSRNGNWPYLGAATGTDDEKRAAALASYASRYLTYRQAIDPLQPGLTYAFAEVANVEYLDDLLALIGSDHPGAVSFHWYLLGNYGQAPTSPDYPSIDHLSASAIWNGPFGDQGITAKIAAARAAATAAGLGPSKIFVGEFGPSWSDTPADGNVSDRLAAALFSAEAQETGKAAGADAMLWFGLSDPTAWSDPKNPWVPSLIAVDDRVDPWVITLRPQYYVSLIYRELYGSETVPVPGGQEAGFSIYAARKAERSYFLLINRTTNRSVSRVVKVKTAGGEKLLRLTSYPHSLAVVEF